jgi:hypothetical protein
VKNGKFQVEFIVPKDIRYNYGKGRIVMYAYDKEQNTEANGSFENIYIGGEAENVNENIEGITISQPKPKKYAMPIYGSNTNNKGRSNPYGPYMWVVR